MYIVELFLKLKEDFKAGKFKKKKDIKVEQIDKCNHLFVPIDSTFSGIVMLRKS